MHVFDKGHGGGPGSSPSASLTTGPSDSHMSGGRDPQGSAEALKQLREYILLYFKFYHINALASCTDAFEGL